MEESVRRSELVVTCDEAGSPLDAVEKMAAHREGLRHLAVSVFLFTGGSQVLLQQRAASKYHSGGLWSNSACTHPMPDESPAEAASRAVSAELGPTVRLSPAFITQYDLAVGPTMQENEYNHVFVGHCTLDACAFDVREVQAVRELALDALRADIVANPRRYTSWLRFLTAAHFDELTMAMRRIEADAPAVGR
jgi:isopentenyl-diphosphate delta-isomerase